MNNTINTQSPAFCGSLRLHNIQNWNQSIADSISNNKVLNSLAKKFNSDILVFQSQKTAYCRKGYHMSGDTLYKVSIARDEKSLLGKIKQFLGLNKVSLSKGYHSEDTIECMVLPNLSLEELSIKL